jgi:glutaredoxin
MKPITFYTKPGCHLCEDGQWLLNVALRQRNISVAYVDISADPVLVERYGERIPVLRHPTSPTELDWPFTPESILSWLDQA